MTGARTRRPRPPDDPSSDKLAYQKALGRLARREMTTSEVRKGLVRDGFTAPAIDAALARLADLKFVDDPRLGARFARSRIAERGLGQHRVRRALQQKGVSRGIIEESLQAALADVSEADAIDRLARRFWLQKQRLDPAKRVQSLWAFLLRRGFPAGLVGQRLKSLWPNWSDALAGLEPAEAEPED
ncbi:MAG: RecX family transcriptional regulator [Vicinamibacteria bacterium]